MCKLCDNTPVPTYFASPRKCAFVDGVFTFDNWNCVTMNYLRELIADAGITSHNSDENIGVISIPESSDGVYRGFLVMTL
jgi:hypothetical protein